MCGGFTCTKNSLKALNLLYIVSCVDYFVWIKISVLLLGGLVHFVVGGLLWQSGNSDHRCVCHRGHTCMRSFPFLVVIVRFDWHRKAPPGDAFLLHGNTIRFVCIPIWIGMGLLAV